MAVFDTKTVTIEGDTLTVKEIRQLHEATKGWREDVKILDGERNPIAVSALIAEQNANIVIRPNEPIKRGNVQPCPLPHNGGDPL